MRFEAAFMSERDDWETPQKLFDELDSVYHFTLDPCSTDANAKCSKHYTLEDDGLSKSWRGEVVFCNPPYGKQIAKWAAKCHKEAGGGSHCRAVSRKDGYPLVSRSHLRHC